MCACFPRESVGTSAEVVIPHVCARGAVSAWSTRARVEIGLATLTTVTLAAGARE